MNDWMTPADPGPSETLMPATAKKLNVAMEPTD